MAWPLTLGTLAALSLVLGLWQWLAARRFPLHRRMPDPGFAPPLTVLKPLKGVDATARECLRSWFTQDYPGPVQLLFAVDDAADPAAGLVRRLLAEFPEADAALHVCEDPAGANRKVAKLARLTSRAKHDLLLLSDADVWAPPDLLAQVVLPLRHAAIGLVTCLYRLSRPDSPATTWETVAVNADFWSQVLQARSLRPLDFALGAVIITRASALREAGGFAAFQDCLADDYQLGRRLAQRGHAIELCPVVVECRSGPQTGCAVWRHQLRWARTIRVCRPGPYFLSQLANGTLWPLLALLAQPPGPVAAFCGACIVVRIVMALDLVRRLEGAGRRVSGVAWIGRALQVPVKDLLQAVLWVCAFLGNRIEWQGETFRLRRDGTLEPVGKV